MEFTYDVIDCQSFYENGQQPSYMLEAVRPEHRNDRGMLLDVFDGEWWCMEPDVAEERYHWNLSNPSSPYIRVPIFSFRTSHERYDLLTAMGFQLAVEMLGEVPLQRLKRVHLVLGDTYHLQADKQLETWLGVACHLQAEKK